MSLLMHADASAAGMLFARQWKQVEREVKPRICKAYAGACLSLATPSATAVLHACWTHLRLYVLDKQLYTIQP
jgi:hypothetical protein